MKKQQICILGSTGSIGTQALDVIAQHPDRYEAYCLTANNSVERLAEQARRFSPACVVIANEARYDELKAKGMEADYEDILRNVQERDFIDSHREVSPLRKADDAIGLDNSDMTIAQQKEWLLRQYRKAVE